jgi:hypothetical protein
MGTALRQCFLGEKLSLALTQQAQVVHQRCLQPTRIQLADQELGIHSPGY